MAGSGSATQALQGGGHGQGHDQGHGHEHEYEALENEAFGFWLYLVSDVVLFGAIFATFAVLSQSFAGGPTGRELFHLPYVFVETLLLLFSSVSYGLTMPAIRANRKAGALIGLAVTFALGAGFIGMELAEFHELIAAGNGPQRSAYLSAFFTLVGTHGAHVTVGLVWMAVMMSQVALKGVTVPVLSRLIRLSMFWHFLDIVWIGVFTIVYLMGVM